jgi:hypothetical protein
LWGFKIVLFVNTYKTASYSKNEFDFLKIVARVWALQCLWNACILENEIRFNTYILLHLLFKISWCSHKIIFHYECISGKWQTFNFHVEKFPTQRHRKGTYLFLWLVINIPTRVCFYHFDIYYMKVLHFVALFMIEDAEVFCTLETFTWRLDWGNWLLGLYATVLTVGISFLFTS